MKMTNQIFGHLDFFSRKIAMIKTTNLFLVAAIVLLAVNIGTAAKLTYYQATGILELDPEGGQVLGAGVSSNQMFTAMGNCLPGGCMGDVGVATAIETSDDNSEWQFSIPVASVLDLSQIVGLIPSDFEPDGQYADPPGSSSSTGFLVGFDSNGGFFQSFPDVIYQPIPEPGAFALFAVAMLGVLGLRRR